MSLNRPHAISFSKKNTIRPFEDPSSMEFWAAKNDASMFVVAQSTKKRPNGMTFVRMFDGAVLDMCEVGVDGFVSMEAFKVRSSSSPPFRFSFLFLFLLLVVPASRVSHHSLLFSIMAKRPRNPHRDTAH